MRSDRVDQVPDPGGARAGAVTGLGIVGRLDRVPRGLRLVLAAPAHAAARRRPVLAHELARPHPPQHPDRRQPAQLLGRLRPVEQVEQGEAVLADGAGVGLALGLGARQ